MTKEQRIEQLSGEICNGCRTRYKCNNNDGFCIMSDVVAEWLIDKGYGNIKEYQSEIERLQTELAHREEDLVHADENVFYRECKVALNEKDIKNKAVKEFAEKSKNALWDKVVEEFGDMASDVKYITLDIDETENKIDELLKEYLDD